VTPGRFRGYFKETFREIIKNKDCYLYLMPMFIIFFLFTILPVIIALFFSFTYFNLLEMPRFIGWDNYLALFLDDDIFSISFRNTLTIAIITGPIGYFASFLLAWAISELNSFLRAVLVTVMYAPSITGGAYMIWSLIFSGDSYGYLNNILYSFNIISSPVQWLTDTKYMMPVLVIILIWLSLGAGFLAFVASFQTVDKSMYEAALVDGVRNRWQELWFITLPSMKPQLLFGAVMSITGAFSVGDQVTALFGNPSTDFAVYTLANHMVDYGTVRYEMGYACSIAVVLFVLMFFTNILVKQILEKVGK